MKIDRAKDRDWVNGLNERISVRIRRRVLGSTNQASSSKGCDGKIWAGVSLLLRELEALRQIRDEEKVRSPT